MPIVQRPKFHFEYSATWMPTFFLVSWKYEHKEESLEIKGIFIWDMLLKSLKGQKTPELVFRSSANWGSDAREQVLRKSKRTGMFQA